MLAITLLTAAVVATSLPGEGSHDECLEIGSARRTAYVVTDGEHQTSCGDMGDLFAGGSKADEGRDVVWFRLDEQAWVVRDPAVAGEARRLFAKVEEIGGRQGAVGAKQGRIGAEQGRIGAKQAEEALRRVRTGEDSSADPETAQARADRMRELGKQMEVLGREQGVLGKQMREELTKAQAGLSRLLDRAIKDGTAVRIRRL